MPSFIDLTGQESGTLIAREYLGDSIWRCECVKCGKNVDIKSYWFIENRQKNRDGCKHVKLIVPGDKFGFLTVIEKAEDYIRPKSGNHERRWKCRCICGREKIIIESNLKLGKSTSCGKCNNRVSIPEKMIYYYLAAFFNDIEENYRPISSAEKKLIFLFHHLI